MDWELKNFLYSTSCSPGALRQLGFPGPALGNIQLVPSRPQSCCLVTMTSVVKTVYTLQPTSVLSSCLAAGGCLCRPHPRPQGAAWGGQAREYEESNWQLRMEGVGREGHSVGSESPLTPLEPDCLDLWELGKEPDGGTL